MQTIRAILAEIVGLFVDDGFLALGLLLWCAGVAVGAHQLPGLGPAGPVFWCLGCALILLLSAARAGRAR